MIREIQQIYNNNNFDFQQFAYPKDELSYRFQDWVPYYRMKYAICKTLNPQSILEIGVRYGYSAITFLNASPDARYLGIDNDTSTYGGSSGAILYARNILKKYNAEVILLDSQKIDEFPGDHWDLIHIDGQQDGDGTFHDLELAIQKATWILIDGYFWSDENLLASSYFMKKYRDFIEYAITIPGYAGDVLIKVKNNPVKNITTYLKLSNEYSKQYYLCDCGGYDIFKRTKGKTLDNRLLANYLISEPKPAKRILDIGCGRGELCFALANAGAEVIGIDYSDDAIKLAMETYDGEHISGSLSFICGDIVTYPVQGQFDVIIASDFIENVEHSILETILQKCSSLLKPEGRIILHTAPNRLYYDKFYFQQRLKAKEAGSWLPPNPRTYYEDIMHINEQTPDSLRSLLTSSFPYSLVWVTSGGSMTGSLEREYSEKELYESRDIFAVASFNPISKEDILSSLKQFPLQRDNLSIEIIVLQYPTEVKVGNQFHLNLQITNTGSEKMASMEPSPVHISYHWRDNEGKIVIFDGIRTAITPPLYPQEAREIVATVISPLNPGHFLLEITMVQEGCFWFEEICDSLPIKIQIEVR